jgi:hypothetical protein
MIFSELGINGVNLSAGYYDAHCPTEYIKIHELERTIHWVYNAMNCIERYGKFPTFDYILEPKYKSSWATSPISRHGTMMNCMSAANVPICLVLVIWLNLMMDQWYAIVVQKN